MRIVSKIFHSSISQCRSCWLNIWQTDHEKRWNSLHIVCEEDQRGRDFPQLRHEFVRSAPFHVRLSVSLAPQSVLLRYIHCHVLLLTTFRDGKCLVSSYCQGQGSISCAILPSRYPWFPIFSHFEGQIPFYIWRGSWGLSFVKICFLSKSIL